MNNLFLYTKFEILFIIVFIYEWSNIKCYYNSFTDLEELLEIWAILKYYLPL